MLHCQREGGHPTVRMKRYVTLTSHNYYGVWNHQQVDWLINSLFRLNNKISKLRIWWPFVAGGFPKKWPVMWRAFLIVSLFVIIPLHVHDTPTQNDIEQSTVMMGEIWGVCRGHFGDKWVCYAEIVRIQGFKGFYSRKYNQLHTSGICGLLRLTSIYITYFVRIKPLVYTMIFQWYVTRLPRVIFNQSQMTRFYMSEISLKYFERNLRAR